MIARGLPRHLALCATLLVACSEGPTGPNVGKLNVSIIGLPAGAAAAASVVGPDGFSESVTASRVFDAVPSGEYIITTATTTFDEDLFASTVAVDTVRVSRGREARLDVSYTLASGSIEFSLAGLPAGSTGSSVTLQGPGGLSRSITLPGVARGLLPGPWQVSLTRRFAPDGHGYETPSPGTINVTASATPVLQVLNYTLATGAIEANFNGLPAGSAPRGLVLGSFGIVATLDSNGTRAGLDPGQYTLAPQNVFVGDIRYSAPSVTQSVAIGLVPRAFSISYAPRSGRLTVAATGLPAAVIATARVTNGSGLDTTIALGDTLRGLPTGSYAVQGTRVAVGGELYSSDSLPPVVIVGAQTSVATLQYRSGGRFDLNVIAAYAVQTVQRRDGSVPLVANRDALVRVLATASGPNALSVPVRVRIVNAGVTSFEQLVPSTSVGVPYDVDESTFQGSWRVDVPGSAIQPGAQLQVTVDPAESVAEDDRANNTRTQALNVRALPTFRARFVPIRFASGGRVGNVSASNSAAFFQQSRDLMPVANVDIDIRSEYLTNRPALTTSDGNIWESLLGDLNALRVAEASQRYYMGIVPVGYTSGIAGIGYLGAPTSLTWDYQPSGSEVLAHELGHNFNRRHAPCGGAGGPDPLYPSSTGDIGNFGWDARLNRLRVPTDKDIMSYCDDPWVSAYTWSGVIDYRQNNEPLVTAMAATQPVLLVWGRISPEGITIEPVFAIDAMPVLPKSGPHRLALRDSSGDVIYSASFRASAVPHARREGTEHFTFAIPLSALGGRSVATLSVQSGALSAEMHRSAGSGASSPSLRSTRLSDGSVHLSDSDPNTRGMIIREVGSGRIISIVTGGEMTLPAGLGELQIFSSDGVRSSTYRIKPPLR